MRFLMKFDAELARLARLLDGLPDGMLMKQLIVEDYDLAREVIRSFARLSIPADDRLFDAVGIDPEAERIAYWVGEDENP